MDVVPTTNEWADQAMISFYAETDLSQLNPKPHIPKQHVPAVPDDVLPQGFSSKLSSSSRKHQHHAEIRMFSSLDLMGPPGPALQDFSRLALILCLFHSQSDSWFKSSNVLGNQFPIESYRNLVD
ncbi:hypothetical protein PSHT_12218 [Puccinia striiformis]|uniref:Uncharacterized protein n=1 Tax=Puccinia striiformis TaxID=27350 RepID=A0A2S4UY90_9BASI|nr:hypothetical protein PSHT_12218 [Puccinia striiformis]